MSTNVYSATWYSVFLDSVPPAQTEAELGFITRHLPNPPYRTVLDLACGQGRHARLLADRRYHVTGLDLNAAALESARQVSGGQVTYLRHDMRRLSELSLSFDAVICLWQSFGYFDAVTNADVLRQISAKLRPNGRLLLDVYHRGFFEASSGARQFERGGRLVTETKSITGGRLTVELGYGPGQPPDRFDWQLFTPEDLCALAELHALTPMVICTGFDETKPASPDSPRMQIVFEKSPA